MLPPTGVRRVRRSRPLRGNDSLRNGAVSTGFSAKRTPWLGARERARWVSSPAAKGVDEILAAYVTTVLTIPKVGIADVGNVDHVAGFYLGLVRYPA